MKIIVRGILQKLLKYWTIRRWNDCLRNPATQGIILEIDCFQVRPQIIWTSPALLLGQLRS